MSQGFRVVRACALGAFLFLLVGCQQMQEMSGMKPKFASMGSIERLDPALDQVLAPEAKLEKLAGEFNWCEGPVWNKASNTLYFSDVPMNIIYTWNEKDRLGVFSFASGYSKQDITPRGTELGSNGNTFDPQGRLVTCQHGDRRIVRWNQDGTKTTLADQWEGKRFNSPNDLIYDAKGNLFFTDPPYGLQPTQPPPAPDDHKKDKELDFQGVYRLSADGKLSLVIKDLTYPNGINISPDQKTLYVAVSDNDKPVWMAYDLKEDGTVSNGRVLLDCSNDKKMHPDRKGNPDGMKVDQAGNLWATGPGGVWIISPTGKHLGTILTGQQTGNVAWGDDGSTLYVMCDMYIARIRTKTKGAAWNR
jgi:gluconolactonase